MYSPSRMLLNAQRLSTSYPEPTADVFGLACSVPGLIPDTSTQIPPYSQSIPSNHFDTEDSAFEHLEEQLELENDNESGLEEQRPVQRQAKAVKKRTKVEQFPYRDATGPFYLYKYKRTYPVTPLPTADRIAESTRPSIPQTTDIERLAVQWEGRPGQKAQEVTGGLESGKKWLGAFDASRPDVLITKCPLKIDGKVKRLKKGNNYPPGNTILPAGKSLQEICEQYPNHVWGRMLRIFAAEGWSATEMFNALPKVAQTPRKEDVEQNRPHNYLQQAVGRQIDDMLLEDGKHRKIREQKNKSHKRKAEDLEDDVKDAEEGEPVNSLRPASKTARLNPGDRAAKIPRKSTSVATRALLSVQHSKVVSNMSRRPNSSFPYPNSTEEMELQQKIDFYTERSKLLVSDRRMNENTQLVSKGLAERLEFVEEEWCNEFNKHIKRNYLLDDPNGMQPPVLVGCMSPLEIMMAIVEYEQTLSGNKSININDCQVRQLAYKRLLIFLEELTTSVQAYFYRQIDESTLRDGVHENMSSINKSDGQLRSNIDCGDIIANTTLPVAPVDIPRNGRSALSVSQVRMPAQSQYRTHNGRNVGGGMSRTPAPALMAGPVSSSYQFVTPSRQNPKPQACNSLLRPLQPAYQRDTSRSHATYLPDPPQSYQSAHAPDLQSFMNLPPPRQPGSNDAMPVEAPDGIQIFDNAGGIEFGSSLTPDWNVFKQSPASNPLAGPMPTSNYTYPDPVESSWLGSFNENATTSLPQSSTLNRGRLNPFDSARPPNGTSPFNDHF